LREQISYTPDPAPGQRDIVPAGIILGAAEVGNIETFLHYNLGSQGGPAATFLGYVAGYDPHSQLLVRAGLFELPLVHSPAQRLDTLESYGYEGQKVGLNDLLLSQPRLGVEFEKQLGRAQLFGTFAIGEYQGAAYGGKPIDTGVNTRAAHPEYGLYARLPLSSNVSVGLDAIDGSREIFPEGRATFDDPYRRLGVNLAASAGRFDLLAEQWDGHDDNADGFGSSIGSYGGYVRLRYAPTPHSFLGVRYDTAAAPLVTRAIEPFYEFQVTPHARLLFEDRAGLAGGPNTFGAALTIALPWPRGL
jgi:hypothetical protein